MSAPINSLVAGKAYSLYYDGTKFQVVGGASPIQQASDTTQGTIKLFHSLGLSRTDGAVDEAVLITTFAPKASPALTGVPTAPTASPGTNNTQIATTAYVDASTNSWKITGTTTLTGATNITSNARNQLTFSGTWTASATLDYHMLIGPTITASATVSHEINILRLSGTLNAGANSQILTGLYISPSFVNGAFTGVQNIAINVIGGKIKAGNFTAGPTITSAIITNGEIRATNGFSVRGATTDDNIQNGMYAGTGNSVQMKVGNNNTCNFNVPGPGTAALSVGQSGFQSALTSTGYVLYYGAPTAPPSGTGEMVLVGLFPVINLVGTWAGNIRLFDYSPAETSLAGVTNLYGITIGGTNVKNGFNTRTPTAIVHVGTGSTTIAQLKLNTTTLLTTPQAGVMEYTTSAGWHVTNNDAVRRHVVTAASSTKDTTGAPLTSDGFILANIGGVDVKLLTAA